MGKIQMAAIQPLKTWEGRNTTLVRAPSRNQVSISRLYNESSASSRARITAPAPGHPYLLRRVFSFEQNNPLHDSRLPKNNADEFPRAAFAACPTPPPNAELTACRRAFEQTIALSAPKKRATKATHLFRIHPKCRLRQLATEGNLSVGGFSLIRAAQIEHQADPRRNCRNSVHWSAVRYCTCNIGQACPTFPRVYLSPSPAPFSPVSCYRLLQNQQPGPASPPVQLIPPVHSRDSLNRAARQKQAAARSILTREQCVLHLKDAAASGK
jgi:hypothetical protein